MTSQMVIFKTTVQFKMGGTSVLNLQKMLDQIFVGIIPLGITLICFYLLKNKKVSVNALLIGVIILGILLSALGIA